MCSKKTIDDITRLLNKVADYENYGKDERVPIVIASMFDMSVIVDKLIKHGVDVNEPGTRGRTALFLAAGRGHDYVCEILLKAGADKNINYKGITPLDAAIQRNHLNVIKLLSN